MDKLEIEQKVKEIVALQFGVPLDEILPSHDFINDLNADSLDSVELVMCVEDRFDMSIQDEDAERLLTVQSVVDFLEKQLAEKSD